MQRLGRLGLLTRTPVRDRRRIGGAVDTDAPTAPGNVAASGVTAETLTLTWDAATDNAGVALYEVQQKLASAGNETYATIGTPTDTTLDVTGLTEITAYRFRVRALDGAGNLSAWSPTDTGLAVTTADETAPTVPGSLAASDITTTTLTLDWTASTDAVGVVSYRVEYAVDGGAFAWLATVAAPTVTLAVTGLTAGTAYRFRVRAEDAAGNVSAWGPDDTGLLATTATAFSFVAPVFSRSGGSGVVATVAPDGSGGYYVGGYFDAVTDADGSHSRLNLCHLDKDGKVTTWNPGSDQFVLEITTWTDYVVVAKVYNSTLTDNTLGGFDCRGLGIVDKATGVGVAWDPGLTATVRCLAVAGDRLYSSQSISGNTLTRHDLVTKVSAVHAAPNSICNMMCWNASTASLLMAGSFSQINSTSRVRFGAVDTAGLLTSWDPVASAGSGEVVTIDENGDVILGGISFATVNGGATPTKGVTKVDAVTALATGWVQDAGVDSSSTNISARAGGAATGFLFAAYEDEGRVYDAATGITTTAMTLTGGSFSAQPARRVLAPTDEHLIMGASLAITNVTVNKLSGSAGLFVINYP